MCVFILNEAFSPCFALEALPQLPSIFLMGCYHLFPQVVQRIKAMEHETQLLVVDKETDEYLRSQHLASTGDYDQTLPADASKGNGLVWKQQVVITSGEPTRLSIRSIDGTKKVGNLLKDH